MAKKILPIPSISRVGPGQKAIVECQINPTYHYIRFAATGTGITAAMIKRIDVIADTRTLQTFEDLQTLIDMNTYHGRVADTVGEFTLWFKDDDYNDLSSKRTPAWGTEGLQTFNIEIQLDPTFPADGAITAYAYIDTVKQPLGVFTRIRESNLNSAVAGDIDYDKLLKGGAVYKVIHFFKADISKVQLEADSNKVIDAPKAVLERTQKSVRPVARVPITAKATHVDFMLEGDEGDLFDTTGINDLRFKLTYATAGNCKIVTEQLDVFKPAL